MKTREERIEQIVKNLCQLLGQVQGAGIRKVATFIIDREDAFCERLNGRLEYVPALEDDINLRKDIGLLIQDFQGGK